jgi:sugar phosphate isomerase/epimerase
MWDQPIVYCCMPMPTRRELLACLPCVCAAAAPKVDVGCQANAWPLEEGSFDALLAVLREMKALGYRGFECNVRFVRGRFGDANAARQAIESTGVRFLGAHLSMEQSRPGDFGQTAQGVAALGGERIVMSARALAKDGRFSDSAAEEKARRLKELARIARDSGTRIAYHNHNDEFANGNAEMNTLAQLIPAAEMDFLVDAGHGYLGGGDPAAFLAAHPKRVYGFHIKTFRKPAEQVPLGSGDFGFEALAAAIRKSAWSGWLIVEEGGGTKRGNTAAVKGDREYIRRVFGV